MIKGTHISQELCDFHIYMNWKFCCFINDILGKILITFKHSGQITMSQNLSNADLLFCDGLDNLAQWDFIDFTGAKMKSNLCEKILKCMIIFFKYATRFIEPLLYYIKFPIMIVFF